MSQADRKNILISGAPRSGKTTPVLTTAHHCTGQAESVQNVDQVTTAFLNRHHANQNVIVAKQMRPRKERAMSDVVYT